MKNVITLLSCAVALVMTSCTLSNEEKAEKLVKETLKDYLYHPDSYEPISTKVDSMFIDVTTIEPIMKISEDIKDLMSKINRCKMKVESAESSMDIFLLMDILLNTLVENMRGQKKRKKKPNLIWINIPRNFQNNLFL
ncbi:hypothetical protein [Bacteroides acidifaciens]|uniref:hypothetical protein n=1 Tax=Bacteroides acidifaciens TaxID=85831 RepID=UPI00260D1EB2|nr:hypothetical protein [Bacteroides acidifaciens]